MIITRMLQKERMLEQTFKRGTSFWKSAHHNTNDIDAKVIEL